MGDRIGSANSISQIGVLLAKTGNPDKALGYLLRALVARLEVSSPGAAVDLNWLSRIEKMLGTDQFEKAIRMEVGAQNARQIVEVLKKWKFHRTTA